jgi:hypothetical protein
MLAPFGIQGKSYGEQENLLGQIALFDPEGYHPQSSRVV